MTAPLQPLLHDALAVLRAPTQVWSAADGSMGSSAIHGVYYSDVRVIRGLRFRVGGANAEHLSSASPAADRTVLQSLLRHLDGPSPDPGVRLSIERTATTTGWSDHLAIVNRREIDLATSIELDLDLDAVSLDVVKQGLAEPVAPASVGLSIRSDGIAWEGEGVAAQLVAQGFSIATTATGVLLSADVIVPARGRLERTLSLTARDSIGAVRGAEQPVPWSTPRVGGTDSRLPRWLDRALSDLDCLRMTTAQHPDRQFLAAGAPWFFTLFGRDSLWAARFLLPLGTDLARDTLHVLAGLQGSRVVDETAEAPGKIMHELRRQTLVIGDGTSLPPLYYGTVDATALWACLLHDAWRWGLSDAEVRTLLPALRGALAWMRDHGDADGDGLLEYVDRSGHGLANQGWKDSGDSVQWRDGSLAEGPIALCEVQAYAFEAAMHGADLLDALGDEKDRTEAESWRAWAQRLRVRFHESFWVDDPAGAYPAIALDAAKRRVDTVTSNLGHLLGTGLLDAEQSALVARRLGSPEMSSGFGLRTMSSDSAGYWPLSYHGGSVWTHDTAIAILGLARDGHDEVAAELLESLLAAAEGFDYRVPELHSGEARTEAGRPVPYPAACRPQAWSAASAVAALTAALRLAPDARGGAVSHAPLPGFERLSVEGLRVAGREVRVG